MKLFVHTLLATSSSSVCGFASAPTGMVCGSESGLGLSLPAGWEAKRKLCSVTCASHVLGVSGTRGVLVHLVPPSRQVLGSSADDPMQGVPCPAQAWSWAGPILSCIFSPWVRLCWSLGLSWRSLHSCAVPPPFLSMLIPPCLSRSTSNSSPTWFARAPGHVLSTGRVLPTSASSRDSHVARGLLRGGIYSSKHPGVS